MQKRHTSLEGLRPLLWGLVLLLMLGVCALLFEGTRPTPVYHDAVLVAAKEARE